MTRPDLGVVHVWRIDLDRDDQVLAHLQSTLSADEIERAERFRTGLLRSRYIVGRATLRAILAAYLDCEPGFLKFRYEARGKPSLDRPRDGLAFNLAHSEGLAICAMTDATEVGIDVERVRPMPDADSIIRRYFSEAERAEFDAATPSGRDIAFFRAWTRKESLLKATGMGLSAMDDPGEVIRTKQGAAVVRVDSGPAAPSPWSSYDLDVGPDACAAVTLAGEARSLVIRDWDRLA